MFLHFLNVGVCLVFVKLAFVCGNSHCLGASLVFVEPFRHARSFCSQTQNDMVAAGVVCSHSEGRSSGRKNLRLKRGLGLSF